MVTVLSTKQVRARKTHHCSTCGQPCIRPGDTYTRQACALDGSVYAWVTCAACNDLFLDVWEWAGEPDEGIGMDSYVEWARDMRHVDPRAVDFLDRIEAGS